MVSQAFESIERRLFGDRLIEISKIELHDLNKESSSELVAEVLSHDITDAATQALAEIVYRTTRIPNDNFRFPMINDVVGTSSNDEC
jgi:hypothetical protein